jgi:hypothetical protein
MDGGRIDPEKDQVGDSQDGGRYEQVDPACSGAICHRASLAYVTLPTASASITSRTNRRDINAPINSKKGRQFVL